MKYFVLLVASALAITMIPFIDGSRILVVAPQGTKSHQNTFIPLSKELVRRGHHVTLITNYISEDLAKLDNVRQIWIEKLVVDMSILPNVFETMKDRTAQLRMAYKVIQMMITFPKLIAESTYGHPEVQDLMATEKFDLVMTNEASGPTCYPFGWHFKAPVIAISPNVLFPGRAQVMGDDDHLSYVPFVLSSFTDKMTLYQRTVNYLMVKLFLFVSRDLQISVAESTFKQMVNPNAPTFIEMEKNISLIFTNTHPSFSYPRTLPPQVIEIGGIHCRPAKPLPEDLEQFVSSSEAGFILFAVGSALKMEDMPEELILFFINTFARLPQKVIWQWKGQVRSDLPKNVLAIPWLPQQDLLGHRNCRAFITHGGLNSLQEAVYHAVPVLALPFGTDQTLNAGRAVKESYALMLDWTDLTQESLFKAIQDLLYNSSYKAAANKLSSMFRDQLQPPLERAVFWTEFVLRHNGTDHLRLGSVDLAPFQRNLIDVYFILALLVVIPILLTYFCVRKCCCRRNIVTATKKKQ